MSIVTRKETDIVFEETQLFFQGASETLADKLSVLLVDKTKEGGLAIDWKQVEEVVDVLRKQQRGRGV